MVAQLSRGVGAEGSSLGNIYFNTDPSVLLVQGQNRLQLGSTGKRKMREVVISIKQWAYCNSLFCGVHEYRECHCQDTIER